MQECPYAYTGPNRQMPEFGIWGVMCVRLVTTNPHPDMQMHGMNQDQDDCVFILLGAGDWGQQ